MMGDREGRARGGMGGAERPWGWGAVGGTGVRRYSIQE